MDPSAERQVRNDIQHHRLTAVSKQDSTIVAFQVSANRVASSASFAAVVYEPAASPVVIAETEIAAPMTSWELRGEGLWADHICEDPFEHWSYGLEAFALQLDDPAELLGKGYGDRVPLGWELEFERDAEPQIQGSSANEFGYSQTGVCHGVLLFKSREVEFEATALRQHWWSRPAPVEVLLPAAPSQTREPARIAMPIDGGTWWLDVQATSVCWQYEPGLVAGS